MSKNNIILIGFMATGKTAVGQLLAKKLKLQYIPTDEMIEKNSGMKISKIFEEEGEEYFRGLETQTLLSLKDSDKSVVSCGGGIVLRQQNIEMLRSLGLVVWLKASPIAINSRLGDIKKRPLLNIPDRGARLDKIEQMLASRDKLYKKAAHVTIDTSNRTIDQVVSEITALIPACR